MNKVQIALEFSKDNLIINEFQDFSLSYRKCKINYKYFCTKLLINMESQESLKDLFDLFFIQYEMLFFNFGCFLRIKEYKENGIVINIEKYTNLGFFTSHESYVENFQICSIPKLMTYNSLQQYRRVRKKFMRGFRAFFYLKSEKYGGMLIDHKFTIITQICCGYNETKVNKMLSVEKLLAPFFNRLKELNKKHNVGIYKALKTTSKKMISKAVNTRHQYSHYINKENVIDVNDHFLYYFSILEFLLRIIIIEDLYIKYEQSAIEYLYAIRDWISYSNGNSTNFKSQRYKVNASIRNLKVSINEYN